MLTLDIPTPRPQARRIGPGVFVPQRFSCRIEHEAEHTVTITVEINDGMPECSAVSVLRCAGCPPLTGNELRRLPITSWLAAATEKAAALVLDEQLAEAAPRDDSTVRQEFAQVGRDMAREAVPKAVRRRSRLTDAEVAAAWQQAAGRAVEVANILNVSRRTAYRAIAAAREAGHIQQEGKPNE